MLPIVDARRLRRGRRHGRVRGIAERQRNGTRACDGIQAKCGHDPSRRPGNRHRIACGSAGRRECLRRCALARSDRGRRQRASRYGNVAFDLRAGIEGQRGIRGTAGHALGSDGGRAGHRGILHGHVADEGRGAGRLLLLQICRAGGIELRRVHDLGRDDLGHNAGDDIRADAASGEGGGDGGERLAGIGSHIFWYGFGYCLEYSMPS